MKSGFIGIIGRPNVGKSSLLNAMLGEKVAIIADKPQTTRNVIRGIYTETKENGEKLQLVFLDTPGIHKPKNKLGAYMSGLAVNTLNEVDLILYMVDRLVPASQDDHLLDLIKNSGNKAILVINKIDILGPEEFLEIYKHYESKDIFQNIIGVSALEGKNIPDLLGLVESYMDEGPQYFPEDIVTDHPIRFLVGEIIREKTLHYLEQEVPHGIAVEIETFEEKQNLIKIGAVIYCEKQSHKGIIIGKGGRKLKGIGKSARLEMEGLLGVKVFLELYVKVRENWRDSQFAISDLGYKKE